jgi:hypothetical protein
LRKLEEYINKVNAEAAYFFEGNGNMIASFIVDVEFRADTCLVRTAIH